MILITGAAGKTGLAVIRALNGAREPIRVFIKNETQAEKVQTAGAEESVLGDLENRSDLERAIKGIRAVYHICPNMHPAEIEIGKNLIRVCQENSIERFVFHSVFHPQIEAMPHHWNKLRVEEVLIGSGLEYTIYQPTAYMQNVLARAREIKDKGVYRVPYSIETRISMVDLHDVAECAVKALLEPGYSGGAFELVGPGYFSQIEIAEVLSEVLGSSVRAVEIPLLEWRSQAENTGLSGFALETLMKMFSYYDRYNFMGSTKVLESLLGRAPTTFEEFLRREL